MCEEALKDGQSIKGQRSHMNEHSRLGDMQEEWRLGAPGGTRPVSRGQYRGAPANGCHVGMWP